VSGSNRPGPAIEPDPRAFAQKHAPARARPERESTSRRQPRTTGGGGDERGLRDLVGGGRSQLGPDRALRARDVNRPTPQDLAEAEQDVVLVHRHWRPDQPT
jgi:hypothetical protein